MQWVAELWIDPQWYEVQESPDPLPSPGLPDIIPLRSTTVLIGRTSHSRGIFPDIEGGADTGISRRQAQLTTDEKRWFVEDLDSANGTFVGPAAGPLPDESPAPEPPAVEPPAREPTNEELQQSWPVLPDAKEESTDSKTWNDLSWWERQQGYEKFRRQHDMGHDQLIDAIKEHQRLSATSDHPWILASDFYGRWYNYKPSEYLRWESTDLRLTIAPWAATIVGSVMIRPAVGLAIDGHTLTPAIVLLVVAAALLIPGLVMVTQSVRASRARARRFMPRPASRPYPLVSRPTGE